LPPSLERVLIKGVRKVDPSLVLGLSSGDGSSYFIAVNDVLEFVHDSEDFRRTLEWGNATPARQSPMKARPEDLDPPCANFSETTYQPEGRVQVTMEPLF
jgi:hypothetical protein